MDANDIVMYEAFKEQQAQDAREQAESRQQMLVRDIVMENYGYDDSIDIEHLINDTYENIHEEEYGNPDIIASVAASLLDEAELGEYDADKEGKGELE